MWKYFKRVCVCVGGGGGGGGRCGGRLRCCNTFGSPMRAMATDNFLFCPPESCFARVLAWSFSPTSSTLRVIWHTENSSNMHRHAPRFLNDPPYNVSVCLAWTNLFFQVVAAEPFDHTKDAKMLLNRQFFDDDVLLRTHPCHGPDFRHVVAVSDVLPKRKDHENHGNLTHLRPRPQKMILSTCVLVIDSNRRQIVQLNGPCCKWWRCHCLAPAFLSACWWVSSSQHRCGQARRWSHFRTYPCWFLQICTAKHLNNSTHFLSDKENWRSVVLVRNTKLAGLNIFPWTSNRCRVGQKGTYHPLQWHPFSCCPWTSCAFWRP